VRKKFSPAPRAALLQSGKRAFFLGPVGIDEGRNVEEKLQLVLRVESLLGRLGVKARVGVLAGGRKEDASRGAGKSLREAEELVKILGKEGIDSSSYEIRIEDAFEHSNVIIAPSGVAGNLIFRTLVFLGSGKGWGAPFLMEKVFIDTSRAKKDYEKAVKLACALANLDL
jgi:predicted methyltransferase MtxX (methanogen marker protein 4)